jgi:YVTN family beta-propeller protein
MHPVALLACSTDERRASHGQRVYVSSDGASTVSVIDTATDQAANSIEVGQAPHGLAITPDGQYLLAAIFDTGEVAKIDSYTRSAGVAVQLC